MGPLLGIALLIIITACLYKLLSRQNQDVEEERKELKANLITTIEELDELDAIIVESSEKSVTPPAGKNRLGLLRKKVSSRKLAIRKTLGKIEVEGTRNWEYRRLQAKRTVEAAKEITRNKDRRLTDQMI